MRLMVLISADRHSEAGAMPSEQLLADMARFNEASMRSGVLPGGEGLMPSSQGARVRFSGAERHVTHGPAWRSVMRFIVGRRRRARAASAGHRFASWPRGFGVVARHQSRVPIDRAAPESTLANGDERPAAYASVTIPFSTLSTTTGHSRKLMRASDPYFERTKAFHSSV